MRERYLQLIRNTWSTRRSAGTTSSPGARCAPALVEEGGAERVANVARERPCGGSGDQLESKHPTQGLEVLGDKDLGRVMANDRARDEPRHQRPRAISSGVQKPASGSSWRPPTAYCAKRVRPSSESMATASKNAVGPAARRAMSPSLPR